MLLTLRRPDCTDVSCSLNGVLMPWLSTNLILFQNSDRLKLLTAAMTKHNTLMAEAINNMGRCLCFLRSPHV